MALAAQEGKRRARVVLAVFAAGPQIYEEEMGRRPYPAYARELGRRARARSAGRRGCIAAQGQASVAVLIARCAFRRAVSGTQALDRHASRCRAHDARCTAL